MSRDIRIVKWMEKGSSIRITGYPESGYELSKVVELGISSEILASGNTIEYSPKSPNQAVYFSKIPVTLTVHVYNNGVKSFTKTKTGSEEDNRFDLLTDFGVDVSKMERYEKSGSMNFTGGNEGTFSSNSELTIHLRAETYRLIIDYPETDGDILVNGE